jgi:hypothetical protein
MPYFLALKAEALHSADSVSEALNAVVEAEAWVENDHSEYVVESGDGMLETACKPNCLAAAFVGESSKRVKEKEQNYERAAGRSSALDEVFHGAWLEAFHGVIPKSVAARWIVQNAPNDPTVYPGSAWTQRGQPISNWRKERSRSKIKSTNDTWPISTPTLKLSSASGKSFPGSPALVSAPATAKVSDFWV